MMLRAEERGTLRFNHQSVHGIISHIPVYGIILVVKQTGPRVSVPTLPVLDYDTYTTIKY